MNDVPYKPFSEAILPSENHFLPRENTFHDTVRPMKKIIFLLVIGLFSCQKEEKADELHSALTGESKRWKTYEGRIPLNEKTNLYMELSMLDDDAIDEGSFILKEYLEADHVYTPVSSFTGKYSTLYGQVPGKDEFVGRVDRRLQPTLSLMWESPPKPVIDHCCWNRACVAPLQDRKKAKKASCNRSVTVHL
jgi:hypothetical protein